MGYPFEFHCFVLFCVLFCFVLFCFVLFCFVLFCFVLFCFVLIHCTFYLISTDMLLHSPMEFPVKVLFFEILEISEGIYSFLLLFVYISFLSSFKFLNFILIYFCSCHTKRLEDDFGDLSLYPPCTTGGRKAFKRISVQFR